MKISERTIEFLQQLVTGDSKLTGYKSGPKLVQLFNSLGFEDEYGQGFPSRWSYATEKIKAINGTKKLDQLVCHVLNPLDFIEDEDGLQTIIEKFNKKVESLPPGSGWFRENTPAGASKNCSGSANAGTPICEGYSCTGLAPSCNKARNNLPA